MKTPREILVARHESATPKLDAIRHKTVDRLSLAPTGGEGRGERAAFRFLQSLWHELFLPSRRIWAGLATVWILILAANISLRDHTPTAMAKSTAPEMVPSLQQQEQLLTELTGPDEPAIAIPQKNYVPRPSSQRFSEMLTT
jgi:hypothetical protein